MKASGNATPCNSFNANHGGGVTCEKCSAPLGVCVIAVHPPEVFFNSPYQVSSLARTTKAQLVVVIFHPGQS